MLNQDFGYLVDPDGMLYEFNAAPKDNFWEHMHFWHEQPYVRLTGMRAISACSFRPTRDPKTRQMVQREKFDPCDVPLGDVAYPTFLPQGQVRSPYGSVRLPMASGAPSRAMPNWAVRTGQRPATRSFCRSVGGPPGARLSNLDEVIAHLKATGRRDR